MAMTNMATPNQNDDIDESLRCALYRTQVEIRFFEDRVHELFFENLVKGTIHLAQGHEAISAGVCHALSPGDLIFCTYRGHGHILARGAPMEGVLGELMYRENGLMHGKGGSMHLTSVEHGVLGSYGIVGAHLPMACGTAWRAKVKGDGDVTVCFFGDGATNIGAFHEALNLASVWKLPVVFVCENNLYMEYTLTREMTAVEHPAAGRAASYGLESIVVDGNDADVVYRTAVAAVAKARGGGGPSLLECMTYRQGGHSRGDAAKYRSQEEVATWLKRDPLKLYRQRLAEFGIEERAIATIEDETLAKVDAATAACRAAPVPAEKHLGTNVFADGGAAWRN
jgi:TPP-dependent pyruvate/acetoin dehydrogenase alpha subunit